MPDTAPKTGIRIAVSSCLLGEAVRYDGGDKRHPYVAEVLARAFELVPVCPEVGIGLGVPRPPVELVGPVHAPRVLGVADRSLDVTEALARFGAERVAELDDVCGHVFKARSPSCGLRRVPVRTRRGGWKARGTGLYARQWLVARPLLPVVQETDLDDPVLREGFVERVFVYRRWRELAAGDLSLERLKAFHAAHRLNLMAHSPARCRELDGLLAKASARPLDAVVHQYIHTLMAGLGRPAPRERHARLLRRLAAYVHKHLARGERAALRDAIEDYRAGRAPLLAPVELLRKHFRAHPDPRVGDSRYLNPEPAELALRYADVTPPAR